MQFKQGSIRHRVILGFITLLSLGAAANAEIVKYDTAWGENCNSSKSFAVKLRNIGDEPRDFRVCLEKSHGGWGCFTNLSTAPGEVYPNGWGFMVCDGTGRYKWWHREAGTHTPFGNP